ncbi:Mak10 subunit, NatC N-terminal acetyltransferase-domain-containing protein [Gloeopeniophorella convolvens]|nr:Mak10 subunit, NatC N-terminal acetyltransferase-domain-containing protein [Gloeopeniophorella convolvens]
MSYESLDLGVFLAAAQDMDPSDVILTEDFTLYDAMSALEIGDPRMDSGLILDEQEQNPPFVPFAPLLPEEVCYILDRAIACEMEWHSGYTLSQTVFSCLYVHHLDDISPEVATRYAPPQHDPARPMELLTVVLRAAITGLLKCCDLSWRELNKGRLFDTEDWHSEKFGVSLVEGLQVETVLSRLDDSNKWIRYLVPQSSPWQKALLDRISLRIVMLDLLRVSPSRDQSTFLALLQRARDCLREIRSTPLPEPSSDSPAVVAFDPHITRKLSSFMPLRAHRLPPQELAWNALADLLDGWAEVCRLSAVASLTTWKIVGDLQASFSPPSQRPPFLRALAQSVFFENQHILGKFPIGWLVDRFFLETIGIEYDALSSAVDRADVPPLMNIERRLSRMLLINVQSSWYNPPRRRRFLSRSLLEWQDLYNTTVAMAEKAQPTTDEDRSLIDAMCEAVLVWRLSTIRELLLSGFQLELYLKDELSFVYWYLSQVTQEHLSILSILDSIVPRDAGMRTELSFTCSYLQAFQSLCTGMYMVTLPALRQPPLRIALNFAKRYKWAHRSEYSRLRPQITPPDLLSFVHASTRLLTNKNEPVRPHFERASDGFMKLHSLSASAAGLWHENRLQVVKSLSTVARELALAVPSTVADVDDFSVTRFDWARLPCRWFPGLLTI